MQREFERAMGWPERGEHFFFRGCNYSAVYAFEDWARATGCGREPIEGPLLFHVGWTGPWLEHFLPDMHALLDSFLATQDVPHRARLLFWLMDRDPDPSDPLIAKYTARGGGAIEFRRAHTAELSAGTCLAGRTAMWEPPGEIQPQTKSDLLRLLLLHRHGGLWIDTDTLLLRDLRPAAEFLGEFGGKFAMNTKFNNAMLGLRRGSNLSAALIELACQHPKSVQRDEVASYCAATDCDTCPCNPTWWYNQGFLQWGARRGMVAAPLQLFDPVNNCAAPGILSGSGARAMGRDWTLPLAWELLRGAYALHTRSYQAKDRPLRPDSWFGTVFADMARRADQRVAAGFADAPHALTPMGPRDGAALKAYSRIKALADRSGVPDPGFVPAGHRERVMLVARGSEPRACLALDKLGGRFPHFKPLMHRHDRAVQRKDEMAVWLWTAAAGRPGAGYLRPSYAKTSVAFCLASSARAGMPGALPPKGGRLSFEWCIDGAAPQLWTAPPAPGGGVLLRNEGTGGCLSVGADELRDDAPCNAAAQVWDWISPQFLGANAARLPE